VASYHLIVPYQALLRLTNRSRVASNDCTDTVLIGCVLLSWWIDTYLLSNWLRKVSIRTTQLAGERGRLQCSSIGLTLTGLYCALVTTGFQRFQSLAEMPGDWSRAGGAATSLSDISGYYSQHDRTYPIIMMLSGCTVSCLET